MCGVSPPPPRNTKCVDACVAKKRLYVCHQMRLTRFVRSLGPGRTHLLCATTDAMVSVLIEFFGRPSSSCWPQLWPSSFSDFSQVRLWPKILTDFGQFFFLSVGFWRVLDLNPSPPGKTVDFGTNPHPCPCFFFGEGGFLTFGKVNSAEIDRFSGGRGVQI